MQTYIANNLVIKAKQMDEDFTLENDEESFVGKAGDYIIFEDGKQRGCPKLVFEQQYSVANKENIKKKQKILQMIQGYIEMGSINLGIANEMIHLENEADMILENEFTTY
ncbi:hypothetical protein EDM57_04380 [Brevibacillus gelatini]|uniref:Uncharacterized protein n=1 Tax=Brevibacillus gelatini TaxID=1655277 RepID=A0A3M8B975_9BACL|nr:hypothetical protein [Brevibacillus gelatini]RNB59385.1 hypothetical protein EDM57_04380 [Brevibacillus gelatini]